MVNIFISILLLILLILIKKIINLKRKNKQNIETIDNLEYQISELKYEIIEICVQKPCIEINKCHLNALVTQDKLGIGKSNILIGQASYLENGKELIAKNHLWNEYRSDLEEIQLYDSTNYLKNNDKIYFNHKGIEIDYNEFISNKHEEFLNLLKNKSDKIITYENNTTSVNTHIISRKQSKN